MTDIKNAVSKWGCEKAAMTGIGLSIALTLVAAARYRRITKRHNHITDVEARHGIPTPEDLVYIAADELGMDPEKLMHGSEREYRQARQLVMYLCHRLLGAKAYRELAVILGVKRIASIHHGAKIAAERIKEDGELRDKVEYLIGELESM